MKKTQKKPESSSKFKIAPLGDRVLIKEAKKETETKTGIIIPETVDKEHGAHRGEVVAVGPGKYDDGVLVPMQVKVGNEVLFQWGDEIKIDGEEYFMVSEANILAVVRK